MNDLYAQVLVDVGNLNTRTFSYIIPEEIKKNIKPGVPVIVPFGNVGAVNAFVVGFTNYLPEGIQAKQIYEVLDDEPLFNLEYLQLLEWISSYYCCDIQTVIDAAIPSGLFSKIQKTVCLAEGYNLNKKLNANSIKIVNFLKNKKSITLKGLQKGTKIPSSSFYEAVRQLKSKGIIQSERELGNRISGPKLEKYIKIIDSSSDNALTKRQKEILNELIHMGGESNLSDLAEKTKSNVNTLKKIAQNGAVEIFDKEIFRNPANIFKTKENKEFYDLTGFQQEALNKILEMIENKDTEPCLLYGITGSGKTEVYMHAVREVLKKNKSVMVLAPEIFLASQIAMRFAERFGSENVAVWHSNISEGEKQDLWKRIRSGEIKIVTGARSAVFAPVKDLGLIIIDEEHESSYKQTSPAPRYNAKTVAMELAKRTNSVLVLGTATPDISTFYRAKNTGKIIHLPERVGSSQLAVVHIVDMREEFRANNKSIFSRALKQSLFQTFNEKKQAILLINRRGFSTYGQCNNCGYIPECIRCDIPLIFHKNDNKMRCHYCNFDIITPITCPSCSSSAFKFHGMGTQKVEEIFQAEFPLINARRIDSDIMTRKNAHIEILEAFSNGDIDVLIGTQMIAKGLDIPNVVLVGVISADSLFNIPDFRGSERGFQLLTQVAGRAGRGDFSGKVYFQTYTPEFFALNHAKEQDFLSFYSWEIQARNEFAYPPFSGIIRFIISSNSDIKAEKYSREVSYRLQLMIGNSGLTERLEIMGPTRCIISKIKDEYRYQIIIKNTMGESGHFMITSYVKTLSCPVDIKFLTDVDPSDML